MPRPMRIRPGAPYACPQPPRRFSTAPACDPPAAPFTSSLGATGGGASESEPDPTARWCRG
eukprot:scaffold137_cov398-Prasinococcus_capsulatus_cf.AAC.20